MRPRRRTFTPLLVAVLAVATTSGCGNVGMPDPVTENGEDVLGLWRGTFFAALAVGALVWGLVVWSLLHRRRDDGLPSQTHENIPIELVYTITPLVIVAALFVVTVVTQERVTDQGDDPDLSVRVTAYQWSWEFEYLDLGITVAGNDDDPTGPLLVLPVDSTVRFELETADVIHSFWVPEFLTKQDMIPKVDNSIDITVTEAGEWIGRCAEFCGLDHSDMRFEVEAVSQDEFDAWVRTERQRTRDTEQTAEQG